MVWFHELIFLTCLVIAARAVVFAILDIDGLGVGGSVELPGRPLDILEQLELALELVLVHLDLEGVGNKWSHLASIGHTCDQLITLTSSKDMLMMAIIMLMSTMLTTMENTKKMTAASMLASLMAPKLNLPVG